MFNKILPLLSKLIPQSLSFKGLQKIDPRIGNYLTQSIAYGYTLDQSLDHLRKEFGDPDQERKGKLRPDEEAANRIVKQSQEPGKIIKEAGRLGLTGTGAGLAASAIPTVLEGLFKQDQQSQPEQQIQDPVSILSQFSPDLANFIMQQLQNGQTPDAAAGMAKMSGQFGKLVKDVERQTKTDFIDFITQLFSGSQKQSEQPQTQDRTPSQQSSNTDQALLAALEKILSM